MSESLLSLTIIFAELGGALLLVLIGWVIYFIYKTKKDGKNTRDLVAQVKMMLTQHKDKLDAHFKDELELGAKKADINVESLLKDEKKLYEHLINVSISKDTGLLKLTINDINALINDYVRMLTLKGKEVSNEDRDSRELTLRKESEALRLENASLATRLTSATDTIENMMGEFSSMYEGGKKEGEQRVKNEMYKLKQALNGEEVRVKSELDELENEEENEEENKEENKEE